MFRIWVQVKQLHVSPDAAESELVICLWADPEVEQGVRTPPRKIQVAIGFLKYSGTDLHQGTQLPLEGGPWVQMLIERGPWLPLLLEEGPLD